MNVKKVLLGFSLLATGIFVGCEDKLDAPKALESQPIPSAANFTYTTNKPDFVYPLDVKFEDKSERASKYSWDFGDPNSTSDVSADKDPNYTYTKPGTYLVRLITFSNEGVADTITRAVDVRFARKKLLGQFTMSDTISKVNSTSDSLKANGDIVKLPEYKARIVVSQTDSFQIKITGLANIPASSTIATVNGTSFVIDKQPFTNGPAGYQISGTGSVVANVLRIKYALENTPKAKTITYKGRGEI